MGSVSDRLRAKAAVRTKAVDIDGDSFTVREVGAVSFGEYGRVVKTDPVGATALLLAECVIEDDGSPALDETAAREVAASARVTMPLVQAIMQVSGFGDDEKEPDAG
jgi:hypothetical protein